jgi:iron complex outermembrane recepter protein
VGVSARGFNNTLANKLLVLVDGRTIYTPLYAGVFWDVQNLPLDAVDRIEVVSGPGGALWGANAVNGVINIITKHHGRSGGRAGARRPRPQQAAQVARAQRGAGAVRAGGPALSAGGVL